MLTRRTQRTMARSFLAVLLHLVLLAVLASCIGAPARAQSVLELDAAQPAGVPRAAMRHRLTLKREAQQVWGLQPPIATFAAQIHQESRWRESARSPVGAQGLAQFMPTTANWIGGIYPSLGERAPGNPTWAIRALVTYDKWIFDRISAANRCEKFAFTLSGYNGGLGWVYKRQRLSQQPHVCLGATCTINPGVSAASQRENEHYARVILRTYERLYATWGPGVCS